MKYIIIPLLKILAVVFIYFVIICVQPARLLIFLWDFNDSWYKKMINSDFYVDTDNSFSYKTALDFILDRKTKKEL